MENLEPTLIEQFEEEAEGTLDDIREWLWWRCGTHNRLPFLLEFFGPDNIDFDKWVQVPGEIWSSCDNLSIYKEDIVGALEWIYSAPLPVIPELMEKDERARLDALME